MQAGSPEPTGTPSGAWLVLCRALLLIALSASAALYVQYLNPAAASFCGLASGCEVVRHFKYSYFFGSSLFSIPLVGFLGFASVYVVSLKDPDGPWTLRLTALGALAGAALMALQAFVLQAFCWLCFVTDGAVMLAFGAALLDSRRAPASPSAVRDPLRVAAWAGLAGLAVALPLVWTKVKPPAKVPEVITALYQPGKINVVEFADFECPFCRMFHPRLKAVLHDHPPERVRFLRKHVPLPSHEAALPAARVAICAEAQGKGEAVADRLMNIEESRLGAATAREAALAEGVDPGALDRCLASSEPERRLAVDTRLLELAGMYGLPTTYVGETRLLGVVSEAAVRDAFERAARGEEQMSISAPVYVAASLALMALVAWLGRRPRGTLVHERR